MAAPYDVIQLLKQFRLGKPKEIIMSATKLISVSFDSNAAAIGRAFSGFDKAFGKLTGVVNREMQAFVDQWFISNGKGEASVKAMGAAIRDSQVVLDLAATGAMEKKTFTEYAQGAMRALHYGVPFSADLKNNAEYALPWGKANKGGSTAKSGKVTSTSRTDLDKTLSKALAQARALGLTEFAADVLDLCLDSLDGFKETVLDK
jgi:hypothetical protein